MFKEIGISQLNSIVLRTGLLFFLLLPSVSFSALWELTPSVAVEGRYEDNIYLSSKDPKEVGEILFRGVLGFGRKTEASSTVGRIHANISTFLKNEQFGLETEEVENFLDAIKDWIDPDNEVTGFGAETSYYEALAEPYSCKNAPLEFLEELLFVRGITRELFYGTENNPGISSYLTTHGDGKININTADPLVLKALSDQVDQGMVEAMIAYRTDEENDLKDHGWYKKVPEMDDITFDSDLVTTLSTYFEIKSEGLRDTMSKRVTGMVERSEGALSILWWKTE